MHVCVTSWSYKWKYDSVFSTSAESAHTFILHVRVRHLLYITQRLLSCIRVYFALCKNKISTWRGKKILLLRAGVGVSTYVLERLRFQRRTHHNHTKIIPQIRRRWMKFLYLFICYLLRAFLLFACKLCAHSAFWPNVMGNRIQQQYRKENKNLFKRGSDFRYINFSF